MKRLLCLLIGLMLLLSACQPLNMNNVNKKPNFAGIVTETSGNSILVSVDENEEEFKSSDLISVSLNVELEDSMTQFEVGDEVRVYYDGEIAESYPAQIHKSYAIVLVNSE